MCCRYLYETTAQQPLSFSDLSLLEWESNNLLSSDSATNLKEAEAELSRTNLPETLSPASIVLFASLYYVATTSSLSKYPAIEKFFLGLLNLDPVKTGIELTVVHTTGRNVDASIVNGVKAPLLAPGSRNLRTGMFAKSLDGRKL